MKKSILFLLILTVSVSILSCHDENNLKKFDLCDGIVEIPNSFKEDSIDNFCNSQINLKNKKENEFISFKICGYGNNNGKRQSFESLNLFFQEEYSTLKTETPEITKIRKESLKKKDYYIFSYEYISGTTFYFTTYIAKEKFYIIIKYKSLNEVESNIAYIKRLIKDMQFNEFENKCVKSENNCSYCKYPLFW